MSALSTVTVTSEGAVPDTLTSEFRDFVTSHPSDAIESLGLDSNTSLDVVITEQAHTPPLEVMANNQRRYWVTTATADAVLGVADVRQYMHGSLLIPNVYWLFQVGALAPLAASVGSPVPLSVIERQVIEQRGHANVAYIHGALRLMALQGWLELSGADLETTYQLTPAGDAAVALLRTHVELVRNTVSSVRRSCHYYRRFREAQCDRDVIDEYESLVGASCRGWDLPKASSVVAARASHHLARHLDGVIVCPTLGALGMPKFEARGDRIATTDPPFFAYFRDTETIDWNERAVGWNPQLMTNARRLLHHLGLLDDLDKDRVRLTAKGKRFLRVNASAFTSLPVSYFPTTARMEHLFVGRLDSSEGEKWSSDEHVDRLANIWGVGTAVSVPRARQLSETVLRRIFDTLPLAEQPRGLSDMGCGEGASLRTMVEFVLQKTARGRHLAEHPFAVVAADVSEVSRDRARENLSALPATPGLSWHVLHGDVTDPAEYDASIRALGLGSNWGARDFLHCLFHLTHDRTLRIRDARLAEDTLREAIRGADQTLLTRAIEQCLERPSSTGGDLQARFAEVISCFRTSFAAKGEFVSAMVAAADLVGFLRRWAEFADKGLLIVELHSPNPQSLSEPVPNDERKWMRLEKIGHTAWSTQHISDQYVLPYVEHHLAAILAGLLPNTEGTALFTTQLPRFRERSSGLYTTVRSGLR